MIAKKGEEFNPQHLVLKSNPRTVKYFFDQRQCFPDVPAMNVRSKSHAPEPKKNSFSANAFASDGVFFGYYENTVTLTNVPPDARVIVEYAEKTLLLVN